MTQWGKVETLNKAMGKLGAKWPDGETGNGALDGAMERLGPFDDAMGKLETLAKGKLGPLMTQVGNWSPRPRILFKRYNTAPLHSFKLMGPNVMQAEKEYIV